MIATASLLDAGDHSTLAERFGTRVQFDAPLAPSTWWKIGGPADATIAALQDGGHTGEVGDGKIFVLDLERVVRIRSGETDNAAVTPVEVPA